MSDSTFEAPLVEQKSSVKISTTAAGKPLVEVKVYAGTSSEELETARRHAVNAYRLATGEVAASAVPSQPPGGNASTQ